MAGFTSFSDILPDPVHAIGQAGQVDPSGNPGGGFASVRLSSTDSLMNTTTSSGRRDTQAASYHKWTIDISYNPMTRAEFQPIYAFLAYRKTIMKPFYVDLPEYNTQVNTGTTMEHDTPKGHSSVMVFTTVDGTLPPQICSIGTSPKIYMVTRAETNTNYMTGYPQPKTTPEIPVPEERYHITPALKEDIASGATFDFTDPWFYVQQVGDVVEYSLGVKNLYSFSLKLEEVI